MIALILLFMLVFSFHEAEQADLLMMFWNVENFFDSFSDAEGEDGDSGFTPGGSRHWTYGKVLKKATLIGKTLLWVAQEKGRMPDVVGFAEVENAFVIRKIIYSDLLCDMDWAMVHYESPDPRGIDTGLIYRKTTLELLESRPVHIVNADSTVMPTRDILYALFRVREVGDTIAVAVNHHPSKYGGKASIPRRQRAMDMLACLCDSVERHIVAMGDFNDTPDAPQFDVLKERLDNKAYALWEKGEGTIRYQGKWELIDMFLEGGSGRWSSEMEICRVPFLLERDRGHGGMKPLRTYSGPRYVGGASDHLPIILRMNRLN